MEKILESFLKKIVTREDFFFLWRELNKVQSLIFKRTKEPLSKKAGAKVSREFVNFLEKLEKEKILPTSPSAQASFFKKMGNYLQNIPQAEIEIAFNASEAFFLKISQWIEEETGQKVILNIIKNRSIVGGAIIVYQGKYGNFSIAKQIDELSLKKELV